MVCFPFDLALYNKEQLAMHLDRMVLYRMELYREQVSALAWIPNFAVYSVQCGWVKQFGICTAEFFSED